MCQRCQTTESKRMMRMFQRWRFSQSQHDEENLKFYFISQHLDKFWWRRGCIKKRFNHSSTPSPSELHPNTLMKWKCESSSFNENCTTASETSPSFSLIDWMSSSHWVSWNVSSISFSLLWRRFPFLSTISQLSVVVCVELHCCQWPLNDLMQLYLAWP